MKPAIVLACLATGMGAACTTSGPTAPAGPQVRRVCDVALHRQDYNGWTLVLEGYLLASRHGSAVTDPRCGRGVAIAWRDSGGRMSRFGDVAERSQYEPLMVRIRVTGILRQDGRSGMVDEEFWLLHLTDAQLLSVQPVAEADADRYMRWLAGPSPAPFTPGPGSRADSRPGR